MGITVVAVFDQRHEANEVAERLGELGIGKDAVRVEWPGTQIDSEVARSGAARLFGIGDGSGAGQGGAAQGPYAEAVRRGCCVVYVEASSDDEADRVQQVMERCGAIDVEERIAQWSASGYVVGEEWTAGGGRVRRYTSGTAAS